MSSPSTTMNTPTLSTPTPGGTNEPPIIYLLHLLLQAESVFYTSLLITTRILTAGFRYILTPIVVVSSPILYILSPVIFFLRITIQTFILTPYRMTVYLLDELYPVYTFVGTATICAVLVGSTARLVTYGAKQMLLEPEENPAVDEAPVQDRKKSRKRVIKTEEGEAEKKHFPRPYRRSSSTTTVTGSTASR